MPETEINTDIVTNQLNKISQDYVSLNNIPTDSEGRQNFTVSVIAFGSLARNELLLVSDIDMQLIVVADDAHAKEAHDYAKMMRDYIKREWAKVRNFNNDNQDFTALEIDSIGGTGVVDGIMVVDSTKKVAELMKSTVINRINTDNYADSRAIYESQAGTYQTIFDDYKAQPMTAEIDKLIDEMLTDLNLLPSRFLSAKQTFIRPITLIIGSLYRKYLIKINHAQLYETNTLKRAAFLMENKIINSSKYNDIQEVLMRSFKWEQEAGLDNLTHGPEVLPAHNSSTKTRQMFNKTSQIRQALSAANDLINKID